MHTPRGCFECLFFEEEDEDICFGEVGAVSGLAESAEMPSVVGAVVGDLSGDLIDLKGVSFAGDTLVFDDFIEVAGF